MLAIKIFDLNGGEMVQEADLVVETKRPDGTRIVKYFHAGYPQGIEVETGHIFVLNDNGKVISEYHLMPVEKPEKGVGDAKSND